MATLYNDYIITTNATHLWIMKKDYNSVVGATLPHAPLSFS
jgi:hypothetical protein